ncbi:MAG TPA: hypothetical protein VJR46_01585 [Candidatus Dormibacteraeota bacterium]|nr:hypothetical protein [Candidatus Dormibacteraeota bacterium]
MHASLARKDIEWAVVIGPKAVVRHRIRHLAATVVAIGVAVLLYPSQPEAGFAVLAVLGVAAGWLLSGRVAAAIGLAEIAVVVGFYGSGLLQWPADLLQVCLLAGLIALAHLTAEREGVARRSPARERRLEGLNLLLEAAEFLAAAPDREAVLNTAVHVSARGISRAGHGRTAHAAFHSVIGDKVNISVVADGAVEREMAVGFEYPIARNQAARGAIRTGRPAFARPDHMTGPLRELADRLGWQVLIMAPVYSGGSLHGLLAATARDGPAVDPVQQFMLRTLARLTSLSLDSAAGTNDLVAAANDGTGETAMPILLPAVVNELRDAVKPIKNEIVDLQSSRNGASHGGEDVAHALGKLDDLISALASRTAIDSTTGLLSRELGLAALERDVLRARRTRAGSHCVAVLSVSTSEAANGAELVRLVADRLRKGLRQEDLIFRYAEDEFVCSFADMDSTDAWPILNRIQTELAGDLGYTPFAIGLTSVGLEQTAG